MQNTTTFLNTLRKYPSVSSLLSRAERVYHKINLEAGLWAAGFVPSSHLDGTQQLLEETTFIIQGMFFLGLVSFPSYYATT